MDALPPARRLGVLLHHLRMLQQSVIVQEAEGRYAVLPVAIEAWLPTAIATAEQLLTELEAGPAAPKKRAPAKKAKRSAPRRPAAVDLPPGDTPYPGGEHGGPAD